MKLDPHMNKYINKYINTFNIMINAHKKSINSKDDMILLSKGFIDGLVSTKDFSISDACILKEELEERIEELYKNQ